MLIAAACNVGYYLEQFLSLTVLSGFTQGAAVLICISQAKHLLAISAPLLPSRSLKRSIRYTAGCRFCSTSDFRSVEWANVFQLCDIDYRRTSAAFASYRSRILADRHWYHYCSQAGESAHSRTSDSAPVCNWCGLDDWLVRGALAVVSLASHSTCIKVCASEQREGSWPPSANAACAIEARPYNREGLRLAVTSGHYWLTRVPRVNICCKEVCLCVGVSLLAMTP